MKLGKIKEYIIKMIGFTNYRKLLTFVMRRITKVNSKIMSGSFISNVKEYSVVGKDVFFGYYDLASMSDDGEMLLSMVVDSDVAQVGYFNVETGIFHKVSETQAWNWQMGARLRWYKSSRSLLFNDYDGINFISRVVNINGIEITRFPYPIFDVDLDNETAYYCDFTILNHLTKGYGYSNISIDFEKYYDSTENGLFMFRLGETKHKLVLSIQELKQIEPIASMENKFHYISHITINPLNKDVMFFHFWTDKNDFVENRMVFVDKNGNLIRIINDFDYASHHAWKDNDSIIVSVYIKGKVEYRIYNYRTGVGDMLDGMKTDGHPTCIDNRFFITDTYPNRCAMQSIYICDSKENAYRNLFSIYHSPNKVGMEKCDLHPRVKDNYINIDSVNGEHRSQYIMKFHCELRGTTQWDRRLLLDKQAYIDNSGPKSTTIFSCMNSEYCYVTGRQKSNKIKVFKMFIENPIFRVNAYVSQMQATTNLMKKKKLSKKLEWKYGIVIHPNCKMGIHFRVDHAVGIVIGAGAVIGDYCKMYQNVTIGQKEGHFPIIGNFVTVFSGAKIIGDIKVGDYAVIGANAVVTEDVPEGAVAVGIPAHSIRK